jgi:hypothetical protein
MIWGRSSTTPTTCVRMLIERLRGHAVRESFHDERPIRHRGQDERRDARVIAHEIALGQFLLRPEGLVQVGHLQAVTVGQRQQSIFSRRFKGRQLFQ